jgi:SCY1-like protein 2
MDKWYVLDDIFPLLQEIPSREPTILMSILGICISIPAISMIHYFPFLGIYKVTMSHKKLGITKDILANKVLPFIIPLCIDNNINLQQV